MRWNKPRRTFDDEGFCGEGHKHCALLGLLMKHRGIESS